MVPTRGLVVSSWGCGSLLRVWPLSRVGVELDFDGWSHRHPRASSQMRVMFSGCGVRYLFVDFHIRRCIWNHFMRTLLVALLLYSVMRVESYVVALFFALCCCV